MIGLGFPVSSCDVRRAVQESGRLYSCGSRRRRVYDLFRLQRPDCSADRGRLPLPSRHNASQSRRHCVGATIVKNVSVVGGSIAGLRAAETLRRAGFDGGVSLFGDEPLGPYQRPPLSKQYLSQATTPSAPVLDVSTDLDITVETGRHIDAVDFGSRQLVAADGWRKSFDGLVIATGARARRLKDIDRLSGVYSLRSLEDARQIRAELERRPEVVVVGAGFIGCEVASSCRLAGLSVTMVDPLGAPLQRVLGNWVGRFLAGLHSDHGTRLLLGVGVAGLEGDGHVSGVRLTDGQLIKADLVVEGLGVVPETRWLESSGLVLSNGVECDSRCRVLGVDGVVAAGDVARWKHPFFGDIRLEHWENAVLQGEAAALSLLHGNAAQPYAPVPFFWSDQYDTKLQLVGLPAEGDDFTLIDGTLARQKFLGAYGDVQCPSAVLAVNNPGAIHKYRNTVACARIARWS